MLRQQKLDKPAVADNFRIVDGRLVICLGRDAIISVPEGVLSVEEAAFAGCRELTRVDFPASLRILVLGWGDQVFADCPRLATLSLGPNLEQFNLSLEPQVEVLFPERFNAFYTGKLSDDEIIRLLFGLYRRNRGKAAYANYRDVLHVYLHHGSLQVREKCLAIMAQQPDQVLTLSQELLPGLAAPQRQAAQQLPQALAQLTAARSAATPPRDMSLLPDFGLDAADGVSYAIVGQQYRAELTNDLELELFAAASRERLKSFPLGTGAAEAEWNYEELKRELYAFRAAQIALLRRRFVSGVALPAAAWRQTYASHPVLRRLTRRLVWSCRVDRERRPFRLLADGSCVDEQGRPCTMPASSLVSLAHPLNLTLGEIAAWRDQLVAAKIRQPICQIAEPVIWFSMPEELRYRYNGLVVPYGKLRSLEREGFHIYGTYEHGYELDDGAIRLHFTFGAKAYLGAALAADEARLDTLQLTAPKRRRQINHGLAVLDRLLLVAAIREDDLEQLSGYIESQTLGLPEDELNEYLATANQYASLKCLASLLDYKQRNFRFGGIWQELRL